LLKQRDPDGLAEMRRNGFRPKWFQPCLKDSRSGPIVASFGMRLPGSLIENGKTRIMNVFAKSISTLSIVAFSVAALGTSAVAQTGRASWYALTSKTANGERCNPGAMTAAHPSLPFGTKVKVENLKNGKTVVVRINDRGPFVGGGSSTLQRARPASSGS
jgi:rare lipoprotein A